MSCNFRRYFQYYLEIETFLKNYSRNLQYIRFHLYCTKKKKKILYPLFYLKQFSITIKEKPKLTPKLRNTSSFFFQGNRAVMGCDGSNIKTLGFKAEAML
jgi:hypothetical protein